MSKEREHQIVPAAENRYRELLELPRTGSSSATVVIPVYNGSAKLAAVLAGLQRQTVGADRFEVVVADDGSEEDIAAVTQRFSPTLDVRCVRQEHDGFGAGRARNLGAEQARGDVLIFVDADCVPDERCIEGHIRWHERAGNVVVVGTRYHVDVDSSTVGMIAAGSVDLRSIARRIPEDGDPDDWRAVFYRRNRKLETGDTAYRAVLSSNFSVSADQFRRVGGFDERFTAWGGEDTEFGWRLWNDGATIAAENTAIVYHLVDVGEDREWREDSRAGNELLMADSVPNRFYRKAPSGLHTVPRMSWLAVVETAAEARSIWWEATRSTYPDLELILVGPEEAVRPATLTAGNPKIKVFERDQIEPAIRATRGEFLMMIDGRMTPHRRLTEHVVDRFDTAPRTSVVRGAYDIEGVGVFLALEDLHAIDQVSGRRGLPLFAVVRRREVMKDLHAGGFNWSAVLHRSRIELFLNDTVTGDPSVLGIDLPPSRMRPGDLKSAGAKEAARTIVRRVRDGKRGSS